MAPLPNTPRLRTLLAAELEADTSEPAADARRAAVAMALAWRHDEIEVLLMRRAEHPSDPWSGQVSLPGGRWEPEDADLLATAKRETSEELDVDLASHALLIGQLPPIQARAKGGRMNMWITPFVFRVTAEFTPSPNEEAEEAFWLPLGAAARGQLDHRHRYQDDQRELLLPAWCFEERVIWGLTYRMLSGLLRVANPDTP